MAELHCKYLLLVDSDELLLDLLRLALEGDGYRVHGVGDVQQAEQAVREQAPDLIVMELMLPGVGGLSFLRWLREERRTDIAVVVLTALDRPGIQAELAALNVAELVYKPVGRKQLLTVIGKALQRKPAAPIVSGL